MGNNTKNDNFRRFEKKERNSIMNKRAIFILGLVTLFFAAGYVTTKVGLPQEENIALEETAVNRASENEIVNETVLSTNSEEVKITPNTELILKKYYKDCGHSITEKSEMPGEMVNLTKEEIEAKYPGWKLEEFSKEEVLLSKELDSFCGEHYLLIEEEGVVSLYSLDEGDNRSLIETTDIAFEYLPETDKVILKNGIFVYGKEELGKIREDFES